MAAVDRTYHELPHARHYFEPDFGQTDAPAVEELMDLVISWIEQRFAR